VTVWTVPAKVVRVVDGDTLVRDLDLGWNLWHRSVRVRLARVDAAEMNTEAGKMAKTQVEAYIAGAGPEVTIVSRGIDKYGRSLAEVRLSTGHNLNDLVAEMPR
jgi:endonuclease YncB( thermonuclease family)